MATVLRNYCENALKVFEAQYGASSVLTHGASLGSVREQIIRDFLQSHLPEMVNIVSGQIFDSKDRRSTQQDAVLVLKSVPRLPFASGIDLIFIEGVVSTIEVKSSLSAPVLKQIGDGIKSVKSLTPSIWGNVEMGKSHSWPSDKILSVVVTYKGSSFDALLAVLASMDDTERPDLIFDLSKGLLIRNHGLLVQQRSHDNYVRFDNPSVGFTLFLTFLSEISGTVGARGVVWRNYFLP
ncbi:DUF6602 domain-containing protein [Acidocella sp.]|uniref:DUF6602 domain-containing protein n=1 Tax=Acidocella sp. TaxID=50710 RepID=UPI003D06243D